MSALTATFKQVKGVQWVKEIIVPINFNDTVFPSAGGSDVPLVNVGVNIAFDASQLPYGAQVVGGELVVDTATTGSTAASVSVGDAALATRYLNAQSTLALGKFALTNTGFVTTAATPLQITVATTVAAATAGKYRLCLQYIVAAEVNENL